MPTENRSSNTEMVSVPRELMRRLVSATVVARGEGSPTQREAEAFLSQPAEQHQGEPVGEVVGKKFEKRWWMPQVKWAESFNPERTPVGTRLYIGPAVADAGEVERLRLEIEQLKFSLQMHDDASIQDDCVRVDNRTLRAQLADRDALLADALQDSLDIEALRMMRGSVYINRLSDRIKAALGRKS